MVKPGDEPVGVKAGLLVSGQKKKTVETTKIIKNMAVDPKKLGLVDRFKGMFA
jgi:hypothetical protein